MFDQKWSYWTRPKENVQRIWPVEFMKLRISLKFKLAPMSSTKRSVPLRLTSPKTVPWKDYWGIWQQLITQDSDILNEIHGIFLAFANLSLYLIFSLSPFRRTHSLIPIFFYHRCSDFWYEIILCSTSTNTYVWFSWCDLICLSYLPLWLQYRFPSILTLMVFVLIYVPPHCHYVFLTHYWYCRFIISRSCFSLKRIVAAKYLIR